MKMMCVDYGRRRLGVAVTDEGGALVRGLATIDSRGRADAVSRLLDLIRAERPDRLLVGLPLDEEDNETEMSGEIRAFARDLAAHSRLSVAFIDESYSSRRAAELLRGRRKKHRRNKSTVDRIAACLLLEEYLAGRAGTVQQEQ